MRSSKAHFKYALKFAKRIEDTAKADELAKDLGCQNMMTFGKVLTKLTKIPVVNYMQLLLMVLMVKPTSQTTGVIIFTAY